MESTPPRSTTLSDVNTRRCRNCRDPIHPPVVVEDGPSRLSAAAAIAGFCSSMCEQLAAARTIARGEAWWQIGACKNG